jgi:twitching motility protein PilT
MIQEILSQQQKDWLERERGLSLTYELPGTARFRGNIFFQNRGLGAVFRRIPLTVPSIESLGLPQAFSKIVDLSRGLALVVGPRSCGKTTTLAAMIDHINKTREVHILTIEDPTEFIYAQVKSLVTQREVGAHVPSFSHALKAARYGDPDVVMVGELGDAETMSLAIECASLGMLVLGALHTQSVTKALDHMIEIFPQDQRNRVRSMLGDSLRAIAAQQLIMSKDGKSRCAAHEILLDAPTLPNLIREGKTGQIASVIQAGAAEGMQSMDASLKGLVKEGLITGEAAYEKAKDKNLFKELMDGVPGEQGDLQE